MPGSSQATRLQSVIFFDEPSAQGVDGHSRVVAGRTKGKTFRVAMSFGCIGSGLLWLNCQPPLPLENNPATNLGAVGDDSHKARQRF